MRRRDFLLNGAVAALGAGLMRPTPAFSAVQSRPAGLPRAKITRIRYYKAPTDAAGRPTVHTPLINQSSNVVVIETDQGLTGIGEGGTASA